MALPPLTAVRAFEAAGRHRHFTRAAEELGMTQAAVSYQVRQLEERLGVALFTRAHGRVALTPAGEQLLAPVSAALRQIGDAIDALTGDDEAVLTLTTSASIGTAWLAPRLGAFQALYPDLAVSLSATNDIVDLADGRYDAALRMGPGGWPGVEEHFLFRIHTTPMCSPEYARRHRLSDPRQLVGLERLNPDDAWWTDWFGSLGLEAPGPDRRGRRGGRGGIVLDNQAMEANAVTAGYGIALMTPLFWQQQLREGLLVRPFEHIHVGDHSQWLVHRPGLGRKRKLARFREWLHGQFADARPALPADVFTPPDRR